MSVTVRLSSPPTGEFWEIPVLYEDAHLLALDKPARLLTSPDRYDPARPNLMRLLHAAIRRRPAWVQERRLDYLANAHRLDFETTGVLLLAKAKPILVALADQFNAERPVKEYVTLAQGVPVQPTFEVEARLAPHPANPAFIRVDEKRGKKARTAFDLLEAFVGYALLRCRPFTGRTHQIRAHLRYCRLPIVGDSLYGGKPLLLSTLKPGYRFKKDEPERPLIGRTALHAERLTLVHPATQVRLTITSPWPKDLEVGVKYLRRYAPVAAG
jgi:RluA family pseudouridine synthase